MKTRNVFWTALLAVSLILAGCQQQPSNIPSDPVEAVKLIADKQKDVTSEHLDLTLDLSIKVEGLSSSDPSAAQAAALFKNFKANLAVNGDIDNTKNDFQLKGSADLGALTAFLAQGADKLEFELVKAGETLYSRLAGQEWNQTPAGSAASGGQTDQSKVSAAQVAEILKKAAKAERVGDESVDGTDSYHFKVTLNPVDLINQIAQLAKSADSAATIDQAQLDEAAKLLKDSTFDLEIWAGKSDLLIRQEKVHVNINLKEIPDQPGATALFDLSLVAKIGNINTPVTISAPK